MMRIPALGLFAACAVSAALLLPAAATEPTFPLASPIGLVPPPGLKASTSFPGFEDRQNGVFIRLIALPGKAFAEIQGTMTTDALRKQGMTVEKREKFALPGKDGLLVVARQQANAVAIRKWLLIAPFDQTTALASFEMPLEAAKHYPEPAIRTALASIVVRAAVPAEEQLALLPFKVRELAGMRLVRVVPGVAVQLTDGPRDTLEAYDQAHVVIAIASGGPRRPSDRDHFARVALNGLPPLKDVRIVGSESMRIGGQSGHEVRAQGKAPSSGEEIRIVQWLRFGTGGYLRVLGIVPKQTWKQAFPRFRAVRDGVTVR